MQSPDGHFPGSRSEGARERSGNILELLNSIRHLPARIIMLTAHPAALDRKKAGFLGAEHYFVKPVDPEELLRVVLEAVDPGGLHNSVQSGTSGAHPQRSRFPRGALSFRVALRPRPTVDSPFRVDCRRAGKTWHHSCKRHQTS